MKKLFGLIIIVIGMLIFPFQVFAVDYSIEKMQINAFLQENGDVHVTEEQIYHFDGKFNGITRMLIPKTDTSITEVEATENGSPLEVEQEKNIHMIHRKGKDESITIELTYTIKNGVEKYADVAEFYWPFFDTSNESDYEQLDVFVHPPKQTDDVIAFGYDEAEETATTENDGTAHFQMGKVPSETKGDIRVAYDAKLFPAATITKDVHMRDTILAEQEKLVIKRENFITKQKTWRTIAPIVVGLFTIILTALLIYAWRKKQMMRAEVDRLYPLPYFVPEEEMSLLATISYTNYGTIHPETISAALLDLVRKGYVKQTDEDTFIVQNRDTDFTHECLLINWLFDEIGRDGVFKLDDLQTYTEEESNQTKYMEDFTAWQQAIHEEVKQYELREKNTKLRVTSGLLGILVVPFTVYFIVYELFGYMFWSIVLIGGLITFAIVYRPKTLLGAKIQRDWTEFRAKYMIIDEKEWTELVDDEQKRAFIYGIGVNDKHINDKNRALLEWAPDVHLDSMSPIIFLLIAANANTHFGKANEVTAATTAGGGTPGSGAGVGGGGGGSGAF